MGTDSVVIVARGALVVGAGVVVVVVLVVVVGARDSVAI